MSYLTAEQIATIRARIATKEAQLEKANAAYEAALHEVAEYRFDSGDGSQRTVFRSTRELAAQIAELESEIDRLNRKLYGTGVVSLNLRRA